MAKWMHETLEIASVASNARVHVPRAQSSRIMRGREAKTRLFNSGIFEKIV